MNKRQKELELIQAAKEEYFARGGTITRLENEEFNPKAYVSPLERSEFLKVTGGNNFYLTARKLCQGIMSSDLPK